jgi:hypothetical protein
VSGASNAGALGVAGSLALNVVGTNRSQALVKPGATVTLTGGDVSLTAVNNSGSTASATAAQTASSGSTQTVGIGASVAVNVVNSSSLAQLQDTATPTGGALTGANNFTLSAASNNSMTTTVKAGAAGGTAVSPAVALSLPTNTTSATLGSGSQLTVTGNFSASASHVGSTTTNADANAVGAQTAVGAGIAITVAPDTTTATTSRFLQAGGNVSFLASGTDSSSASASAGAAGADTAKQPSNQSNASGQANSQLGYGNSVSGSSSSPNLPPFTTSSGNIGVAAALGLNVAISSVSATIPAAGNVTAGGTLTLSSSNNTNATAGANGSAAGTAGSSSSTEVGVGVAINVVNSTNDATIGQNAVIHARGLTLSATMPAESTNTYGATAVSGASNSGSYGIAGSVALNIVGTNESQALVESGATVTLTGGDVSLTAVNSSSSTASATASQAGSSGSGPAAVGVGASVALNVVNSSSLAEVQNSATISGAGNFSLSAVSTNIMITNAIAGAAAAGLASTVISATAALSVPTNTTQATLGTGGALVIGGNLSASAIHAGLTNTTADASAAGSGVAVGAAVGLTVATDTTTASTARSITAGGAVSFAAQGINIDQSGARSGANGAPSSSPGPTRTASVVADNTQGSTANEITANKNTITNADLTNLSVGMTVTGNFVPAGTTITAINTTNKVVTLSNNFAANASGTTNLQFVGTSRTASVVADNTQGSTANEITANKNTITNADLTNLSVGMTVTGNFVPAGTTITAIDTTNKVVTLSNNFAANASGTTNLQFVGASADTEIKNQMQFAAPSAQAPSSSTLISNASTQAQNQASPPGSAAAVGAAAAIGINVVNDTTTASINNPSAPFFTGLTVRAGGPLTVVSSNDTSTGISADGSATNSNTNIGAAVAVNVVNVNNNATLGAFSTIQAQNITIQALTPGGPDHDAVQAIAGAGIPTSSGPTGSQTAVAGAVGINVLNITTEATVGTATLLTSQNAIDISASNDIELQNVAGAKASGVTGVGAAIALNVINHTTEATLGVFSEADAANAITIEADASLTPVVGLVPLNPSTYVWGGTSAGGVGVAGSLSLNIVNETTQAVISAYDRINTNATPGTNQSVSVLATDTVQLTNWAGANAVSAALGIGAGIDVAVISTDTEAHIGDSANVHADQSVTVEALAALTVSSLTAAVGAGLGIGVAGAASVYVLSATTLAYLGNYVFVTAMGNVLIEAESRTRTSTAAGSQSTSEGVSVGAAVSVVVESNTTKAYIGQSATVSAFGQRASGTAPGGQVDSNANPILIPVWGIAVTATANDGLSTQAAGGAQSLGGSVAGSVTVNVLSDTTQAYVDQGTSINGSNTNANPNQGVYLLAVDNTSIQSNAGATASAVGLGIGAGVDVGTITKDTEAYLAPSVQANAAGTVTIQALANEQIVSLATAGAKGGVVGLAGGVSVYNVTDTTLGSIRGYAHVSAGGNVIVGADDASTTAIVDGTDTNSKGATISGSVAVTIFHKTTVADIESNASVTALGNQGASFVPTGNFTIGFTPRSSIAGVPLPGISDSDVLGHEPAITKTRTATPNVRLINGVAVTALSQDSVETYAAGAGAGGLLSVPIVAAVNVPIITTSAYIGLGAQLNVNNTGAGANQSVLVAAGSDYYHLGIAGTASQSVGTAVAPGAEVDVVTLNTTAYIASGAKVNAVKDVQIFGGAAEYLVSAAAGMGQGGTIGFAGSVSVVSINDITKAYIGSFATVNAGGNIIISANDTTHTDLIDGAGVQAVGLGVGGAVAVTLITKDTEAYIGQGAVVNAGGFTNLFPPPAYPPLGLSIQATSSEDIAAFTASGVTPTQNGNLSPVFGLAGAVSVEIVTTTTQAYIAGGAQVNTGSAPASSSQSVNLSATDNTTLLADDGSQAGASALGIAGSVDVGIFKTNTAAFIGSGAQVNARQDVGLSAQSTRNITSHMVSMSSGAVALGGAVWVYTIGTGPDTYAQGKMDGTALANYVDGQTTASSVTGALGGYSSTGSNSNQRVANSTSAASTSINNATPKGTVASAMNGPPAGVGYASGTLVRGGTVAFVGSGATVSAGRNVSINASDTINAMNLVAGQAGGGVLTFGAAVGVAEMAAKTQADIDQGATVSAGTNGTVGVNANLAEVVGGNAYAGTQIGQTPTIAVEVQVVYLSDTSTQVAYVNDNADIPQAGNVQVQAQANRTLVANSEGNGLGGLAVGIPIAIAKVGGSTKAYLGTGVHIGADTGKQVQGLSISANSQTNAFAGANALESGTGGAGDYENASTTVNPTVNTYIGTGSNVKVASDIGIAATGYGDAISYANGNTAAPGVAVGIVQSFATLTPSLSAYIGSSATINAGRNINLQAAYNYSPTTGVADAESTSGSSAQFLSGAGATANTVNSPALDTYIDAFSQIRAGGSVSLNSQSHEVVRAKATGAGTGFIGIGASAAGATAVASDKAHVNYGVNLNAGTNLTINASSVEDLGTPGSPGALAVAPAHGVVAVAPLNNSFAVATPTLQASIGGSDRITVGGHTNITAGVTGDSIAEADGTNEGTFNGGESQATATWAPTVTASIGDSTNLSSGGNVIMQATNGYIYANSATATSSLSNNFIGGTGASASVVDRAKIDASIGSYDSVNAGNNFLVTASSLNLTTPTATGQSTVSGLYTGGEVDAHSTLTNEARAFTGIGNSLVAGGDVRFHSESYLNSNVTATHDSGSFTSSGTCVTDAEVTSDLTESQLGMFNTVQAGGQFTLEALNSDVLNANSTDFEDSATSSTNKVRSTARILGSLTYAALGNNCNVQAAQATVKADDTIIYALASSTAATNGNFFNTTDANAAVDAEPLAWADIGQGSTVVGNTQITILAHEDSATTNANAYAVAHLVGNSTTAETSNTLLATALTWAEPNSRLATAVLDVEAPMPNCIYIQTPSVNHGTWGTTTSGTENCAGTVNFNSAVTVLAGPNPSLHIDPNGNIVTAVGVTAHFQGNDIVVDPINVNPTGSVTFTAGLMTGNYSLDFKNSFNTVTILNESWRNLDINGMQTSSSNTSMNVIHNVTTSNYTESKQTSSFNPQVTITNRGTSAINVNAPLHNDAGTTTITNVGGSILSGGAGDFVETSNLTLTAGGSIGTSANRVSAHLVWGLPQSFIASGQGDVYVSLQAFSLTTSPVSVSVPVLHSGGHLDLQVLTATGFTFVFPVGFEVVPVAGTYYLNQVTAGSDITVNAADTTLYVEQMASTSGNVSVRTSRSGSVSSATTPPLGSIYALGGTNEVNFTARALNLNAAGDLGQSYHYLNPVDSSITVQSGTGNIFVKGLTAAPTLTISGNTTVTVGNSVNITIQTSGFPAPTLSRSGSLPSGVTYTDNHNGTATISGVPAAGSGGTYTDTITATNCAGSPSQTITLTVGQPATITNTNTQFSFTAGSSASFTVVTAGYPRPTLTESGALPLGMSFNPANGVVSGTISAQAQCGVYSVNFTASNSFGPQTRNFTITVGLAITSPSVAYFTGGQAGSFTITTAGLPYPSINVTGLPSFLSFHDNGNGTATISGTPPFNLFSPLNTYAVTITASDGISSATPQTLTLVVFF